MLTSFLEKSRPINFLILGGFVFIGYLLRVVLMGDTSEAAGSVFYHLLLIVVCVLPLFVLNFIITKNSLTQSNTFTVFFYTCFLLMLPVIFHHPEIMAANLFLLLAIRRIVSLRTDTNSPQKILDASLWITVASLFYFWSLLLFIPLWTAIARKPNTDYKQMLMPFVGFILVFLIVVAYQLGINSSLAWFLDWKKPIATDFAAYNHSETLVPITIILGLLIWNGVSRIANLKHLSLKDRPKQFLLFHITLITLLISLGAPEKTGAEFLFALAPISIIATNYFEQNQKKRITQSDKLEFWFKEILLWLVAILAVVFLFL
jgi:hypothetical protein